jgi:hypothetical protein
MSPDDVREDDARYFAAEAERREREDNDESDNAEVSL